MTVNDREAKQYSGVVVFVNFTYLRIVYITSMNTVYYLCNKTTLPIIFLSFFPSYQV